MVSREGITGIRNSMRAGPEENDGNVVSQCLRDIVALSTLPAIWSGADPLRIAESLAASLFTTLHPEFVYVSFVGDPGAPAVAVAQTDRHETSPRLADEVGAAILGWARAHDPDELLLLPGPQGSGRLRVATRPIEHHAELGVIAAAFAGEGAPTSLHHLVLDVAASQAATAVRNAHLLRSLREETRTLETLNRSGAALASELDLDRAVQAVTDAGVALSGAEFGAFFYNALNEAGEAYMLYTLSGAPREAFASFPIPRNTAVFGPTFRGEGIGRSDDITRDPRYGKNAPYRGMPEGHLPVRSYLAVPVVSRSGEVLGGLFFGHSRPGVFTERAERLLIGVAAQAAVAIDNARLFEAAQQEIVQRKEAEQALRASREQLAALLGQAAAGFAQTDLTGRFLTVNDRYCDIVGRSRAALLGLRRQDITHPEDLPRYLPLFRRAVERGEPFEIEKRYVRPDGSTVWVNSSVSIVRDVAGRPESVFAVVVDVTERKRAEEALRMTEAQLQAVLNDAPLGVYLVDSDFRIRAVNPRALPVFGDIPDLIGRDFDAVIHLLWPKAYADEVVRIFRHTLDTGEPYHTPERIEQRLDRGVTEYYDWQISRIPLPEGSYGVTCYFRDISAQVHTRLAIEASAEAYRELNDTLERKVKKRTRALEREMRERQQVEAELQQAQKMESVGQLTGGIAHDFNNVLAAIIGNLELARARAADPKIERFLENAQHAAERGAKLTDHLLSFARKQALRREPSDLNRLVASFKDLLARSIGPSIEVRLALAADLWTVMADASQFEMALLNLAVNARDAMPEGGALTIETTNVVAGSPNLPGDLAPGDYVSICVGDTGTGMSPEIAARVFEPFYTTKEIGKGTGLGLSQVYGFSKQLGGTATLSSKPGVGTRVCLFLPRAPSEASAPAPERAPAAPQPATQAGARILVIDDEPDVREIAVEVLRDLGFVVTEAETARRGLEILGDGTTTDLAVVDFAMPEMNGMEFIRRARLSRPLLPVLLVTGYVDIDRLGDMPADDVTTLRKPFKMSELAAAVDRLLRQPEGVAVSD